MRDVDRYIDRVLEAIEQHPTWDCDDILRHVFKTWTGEDPESFIQGVKDDMERAFDETQKAKSTTVNGYTI